MYLLYDWILPEPFSILKFRDAFNIVDFKSRKLDSRLKDLWFESRQIRIDGVNAMLNSTPTLKFGLSESNSIKNLDCQMRYTNKIFEAKMAFNYTMNSKKLCIPFLCTSFKYCSHEFFLSRIF